MPSTDSTQPAADELGALYERIDREAARLADLHRERLQCRRGCSACCLDGLSVRAIEASRIERRWTELLTRAEPHPAGACAFLDADGACRIYEDRPAVCRTQGLPLRVLFEDEAGGIAERRDICPLNAAGGPALETLAEDDCWLIGPVELELDRLERRAIGTDAPRRSLRGLFRRQVDR